MRDVSTTLWLYRSSHLSVLGKDTYRPRRSFLTPEKEKDYPWVPGDGTDKEFLNTIILQEI